VSWLRRHPILCFVVITYAVTWSAWLALAAAGRVVTVGTEPLYLVGLLGPLVGAVVTSALRGQLPHLLARCFRVRVGLRWWLVAIGVPTAIAIAVWLGSTMIATFGIAHERHRDFGAFTGYPHVAPLALWVLLIAIGGIGEEAGWRGFLLPATQRRRTPVAASLVVGAIWTVWHLPALLICDTYRAMPVAMFPMFVVGIFSASIFLTWLFRRAHRSVPVVAAFHGTYNLFSGTRGAAGVLAALETTAVVVAAVILVVREIRGVRRGHASPADLVTVG
jgi:membrane protease YdiL (CAAX protease family)